MDKSKLELKVGVFVFAALIILSVFIFKIGNLKNYGSGYPLKFVFGNVSGVKPGSPVRFSGVDVGEVSQVNVIEDEQNQNTRVEVLAWIRKSLSIPRDSYVGINTLGLLGEKYIEITPPLKYKAFLKPGEAIYGVDPVQMQNWIDEGQQIVDDLQEILGQLKSGQGTIGKLLYDDRLYQELEGLISDIRRHPWKLFWKTKEK